MATDACLVVSGPGLVASDTLLVVSGNVWWCLIHFWCCLVMSGGVWLCLVVSGGVW